MSSPAESMNGGPPSYFPPHAQAQRLQSLPAGLEGLSLTKQYSVSDASSVFSASSLVSSPWATAGVAGGSSIFVPPSLHLRFTGSKKKLLESTVVDQNERVVYSFKDSSKASEMKDIEGKTIAKMEWHTFGSNVLHYHGNEMKIKDFIPVNKKSK